MPIAREVAGPLFDIGVTIAAMQERQQFKAKAYKRNGHFMILLLQGKLDVSFENSKQVATSGQLIMAPAQLNFSAEAKNPVWLIYLYMKDIEHWNSFKEVGAYIRDYESQELFYLQLRLILNAMKSRQPRDISLAQHCARALVNLLTHELEVVSSEQNSYSTKLRTLLDEISKNPQKNWSVEIMAKKIDISPGYLNALFRKEFNISPMEAVIRQRMQIATTELLTSDKLVEDIANDVGYESLCSFSRLFKKHIGMAPGQYRKSHQQEHYKLI